MIYSRITETEEVGCIPESTCPNALEVEDLSGENPNSLTIEVCNIPNVEGYLTAWGRELKGEAVECHIEGLNGQCKSPSNPTKYMIISLDEESGTEYVSGISVSKINNGTYYSYTEYNIDGDRKYIQSATRCIYRISTPQYIIQFPNREDESEVEYSECISIDNCPGTALDAETENSPVRCKLTVAEAKGAFGEHGSGCRGGIFGACRVCIPEYIYKLYGKSEGYLGDSEYFYDCLLLQPVFQDVVCKKLNELMHFESMTMTMTPQTDPLFECFHIHSNIIYI